MTSPNEFSSKQSTTDQWLHQAMELEKTGGPFALVTIIKARGSSPREVGAKMLVGPKERIWGTIGGGRLEELAIVDAQTAIANSETRRCQYPLSEKLGQCCGGFVEILIEPMNTGPHIFIFGAGHVGTAVANSLVGTAFKLHIIDERTEWCNSPNISQSVRRHHINPLEFITSWKWDTERSWILILTHSHQLDFALTKTLAPLHFPYLGLIGSKTKWRKFQSRLTDEGLENQALNEIHCPVGLDLGGETPQEIAISISAEIISLFHKQIRQLS